MQTPLVFGYCHVTSGVGLDLAAQKEFIEDYYRRHLQPAGYKWWNWYVDTGQSCRFWDRPAADKLTDHARRGDAIVVATADRACHSIKDFVRTLKYLADSGLEFHIAREELEVSGQDVARLLTVFREIESTRISQQRRETALRAIWNGQPVSGSSPIGLRWKGPRGKKKLVPDLKQRRIMSRIVEMKCAGMSFEAITLRLERDGVRHDRHSTQKNRPYSKDTVWRMYHQELLLRAMEYENADLTNPTTIQIAVAYTRNPGPFRQIREKLDELAMAGEL